MGVLTEGKVYLGTSVKPEYVALPYANRHGLITGATGTGKTVSLQIMAEGFSRAGVPVFCADIKGDLSGIAVVGNADERLAKRASDIGFAEEYRLEAMPVMFWDIFGEEGHPVRATVSEMGPLLLSRLLDLNDTQEGVLNIAFKIADDEGLLLLDLKDLQAMLSHLATRLDEVSARYGNVTKATLGTIQRSLLVLEQQGGASFFGEPALAISDLMRTTTDGRGMVSVLAARRLMSSPRLYATFLLWLMSELFEALPEVGDPQKPRLVFFFDEAHLLFDEAPKALLEKVEQVVRLIRSKGVGVYFCTQSPLDVPDTVLAQLGNRVQHALRAYSPREVKAVKAAADTFRPNPEFSVAEAITGLGVGQALVSTLEDKGVPSIVQKTLIRPPSSRLGPATDGERRQVMLASPVGAIYDTPVDRDSAFERLQARVEPAPAPAPSAEAPPAEANAGGGFFGDLFGTSRRRGDRLSPTQRVAREVTRSVGGRIASDIGNQVAGSMGRTVGRAILRGMLGSLLRS